MRRGARIEQDKPARETRIARGTGATVAKLNRTRVEWLHWLQVPEARLAGGRVASLAETSGGRVAENTVARVA